MIIGFLGKGGSGKSTVSTNLVRYLASDPSNYILAIDADHNMDLTYNLGQPDEINFLGDSLSELKLISGLREEDNYRLAISKNQQGLFNLSPSDEFTSKYTEKIQENLLLMSAGPQTDVVLSDKACSHILFTSLKTYLPLLSLKENEWIIVDEKAGADGASTGIPTGFDIALIISEPTIHSLKTAKQIAGLLDHFDVPYEFVMNKVMDHHNDTDFITELGKAPIATIGFDQSFSTFDGSNMTQIAEYLKTNKSSFVGKRYERSKNKFEAQLKK